MEMWTISGAVLLQDGSMVFDVHRRLSEGPLKLYGFKLDTRGRLLMPSVFLGNGRYKAIVDLPVDARPIVKNKAVKMHRRLLADDVLARTGVLNEQAI